MGSEKRKSPRKKVNTTAFLYTVGGEPLGACRLKDISAGGARFAHTSPGDLPDEFVLFLSKDGRVRRRCTVVWREGAQVGVRFVENE
jgi:hypothetical protein